MPWEQESLSLCLRQRSFCGAEPHASRREKSNLQEGMEGRCVPSLSRVLKRREMCTLDVAWTETERMCTLAMTRTETEGNVHLRLKLRGMCILD